MRLEGKVAIVTGAASGMGAATARAFAREGASVWLADRFAEDARAVADTLDGSNGRGRSVHLDVTDEPRWGEVVEEVLSTDGHLDILVNCAGMSGALPDDPFDVGMWADLFSVNSSGPFYGVKHAIGVMRKSEGAAVTNVCSVSAVVGNPGVHPGYNASKGALRSLTRSLAVQLGRDGIRVNSVYPGLMPAMRGTRFPVDASLLAKALERVPLGRIGRAEEVANAVLFLSSDEASYITGADLYVDGGYLAL